MALSAELEKLLSLITDEKDREAKRKLLTELEEGGLRQTDYSRKMNELDTQRKDLTTKHEKNLEWYGKAKTQYESAVNDLKAANEKIAALETTKASIGSTGGNLEDDELAKQLNAARAELDTAKKTVTNLSGTVDNFKKMIDEGKLITEEKFNDEVNKRGDALGAAILDIWDLQRKHRDEFGSELSRKDLIIEAQKHGGDLNAAYDILTAKTREEKLRKDIRAEVEKEFTDKQKAAGVPYAPSGEPSLGPLQSRLQKKETGIPNEVEADGSGRLAALMAQELRQEGKT